MCTERQLAVVGDMTIDAEHPRASEGEPSLSLRPLQPGEQLWDIAKHYHTTVEELMRANELTDSEVLGGKMLLIPRQR